MPRSLLLALALLLVASPLVRAQDTGGSFGGGFDDDSSGSSGGGGSYGSDGGGSYDSGGGSGGGGSYDSGSSSDSGSSYDSGSSSDSSLKLQDLPLKKILVFCAFAAPVVIFGLIAREAFSGRPGATTPPKPAAPTLNVITVQLAIDWRARRNLQDMLLAMAKSGKTRTKEGRVELLGQTVYLLTKAKLSWLHARWDERAVPRAEAQGVFNQATTDARARFKREVVRDASGTVQTEAAPATAPRPADGPGVVVVSVFVATTLGIARPLPADARSFETCLRALLAHDARSLVALEVVWSPAVETDRLSTAELEVLYPELKLLDAATLAGRVFCAHCTGPYAKELGACPHCGAPVA